MCSSPLAFLPNREINHLVLSHYYAARECILQGIGQDAGSHVMASLVIMLSANYIFEEDFVKQSLQDKRIICKKYSWIIDCFVCYPAYRLRVNDNGRLKYYESHFPKEYKNNILCYRVYAIIHNDKLVIPEVRGVVPGEIPALVTLCTMIINWPTPYEREKIYAAYNLRKLKEIIRANICMVLALRHNILKTRWRRIHDEIMSI